MLSFEQEIKQYLKLNNIVYIDNSSEYKLLDFTIPNFITESKGDVNVSKSLFLEVKEKRQKYNLSNWSMIHEADEVHTFIVDELSCRKILAYSPFSGLLVRDNLHHGYYWFSILDLFLMPKKRANRQIQKNSENHLKGKLFLDFRNANKATDLDLSFSQIRQAIKDRLKLYTEKNECHGDYYGEAIPVQGITRTSNHWDTDVNETR